MLENNFSNEFNTGTKVLFQYLDANGKRTVKEEITTITSITHYNGNLYDVTFKELNSIYALSCEQIVEMKEAYSLKN